VDFPTQDWYCLKEYLQIAIAPISKHQREIEVIDPLNDYYN